jgi:hypothetical protein
MRLALDRPPAATPPHDLPQARRYWRRRSRSRNTALASLARRNVGQIDRALRTLSTSQEQHP